MNRFEFLKKIKLPKFGRPSMGQVIFWVVTAALSVAVFIFASNFTQCFTLAGLPGIPPASCGVEQVGELFNPEGTPIVDLPPTPVVLPEVELPSWDGASRINILFIGLDA
ncbi:MAG: hypothetical protein AABZ00_19800, partial [Chloroflexota bacterium]